MGRIGVLMGFLGVPLINRGSPTAIGFVVLMSRVLNFPLIRQFIDFPWSVKTSYQLPVDFITSPSICFAKIKP